MKKLTIVGAGVGKDLITLKGLRAIYEADAVFYDRLVDNNILNDFAGEKVYVGKTPYEPSLKQHEINGLIEKYLMNGKSIVRLKSGDPSIYAQSVEEISVARNLQATVEIIPGVTTASYFSSKLETALTSREDASGVIFMTGHKKSSDLDAEYKWKSIVELKFTIVIYMGAKNFAHILHRLVENGLDVNTPIAIGEKLSECEENIIITTVNDFLLNLFIIQLPAIIIVGDVLKSALFSRQKEMEFECIH